MQDDAEHAFPNVAQSPGSSVQGIVFALPQAALDLLDQAMSDYSPTPFDVEDEDGSALDALVYIATETDDSLPPQPEILGRLYDLAQEQGFEENRAQIEVERNRGT